VKRYKKVIKNKFEIILFETQHVMFIVQKFDITMIYLNQEKGKQQKQKAQQNIK